jgi:putative FmdB family regulatory protein
MPTYEYQCKGCSHRFEIWQKMADEPLTICPKCGGTIRRVLFPAGVVFKGAGFYKTDYANGSNGKGAAENGHSPKSDGAETPKEGDKSTVAADNNKKSTDTSNSTSGAKTGESKVAAKSE